VGECGAGVRGGTAVMRIGVDVGESKGIVAVGVGSLAADSAPQPQGASARAMISRGVNSAS